MQSGETRRCWNSTLKRKKPLSSKLAKNGKPPKRTPLKKQSRSQRDRLAKYAILRRAFLADPANADCEICRARREDGENIRQNAAVEIHHKAGRYGANLFTGFCASCRSCRDFPHANPKKARALGLLV